MQLIEEAQNAAVIGIIRVGSILHVGNNNNNSNNNNNNAALNDIVHRSLSLAGIVSTLEPSGLSRSDGKRPDGLTFVPWERGRPLLWDVTIPDTMANSYCSIAALGGGLVSK